MDDDPTIITCKEGFTQGCCLSILLWHAPGGMVEGSGSRSSTTPLIELARDVKLALMERGATPPMARGGPGGDSRFSRRGRVRERECATTSNCWNSRSRHGSFRSIRWSHTLPWGLRRQVWTSLPM
eukprot:scaffold8018_cov128-Skeletonema_dohrnii-CCMP3373.AAC.3